MNTTNNEVKSSKFINLLIGAGLGLLSLVVYLFTLSAGAYPDESSSLIMEYTGIFPKFLPTHPLWAALVSLVSRIPAGGIAAKLNVLSAICGAGVVWLVYDVMSTVVRKVIALDMSLTPMRILAARLGGIIAALYMAFCIPFWMLSTRAHTAGFDLLIMLLCVKLFIHWLDEARRVTAVLLVFLLVMISAEFATVILLVPIIGIVILLRL